MFKKLWMWFWNKSKIVNEITKINNILEKKVMEVAGQIEELDQEKIYMIQAPGYTKTELQHLMNVLERVKGRMRWTAPPIIVVNTELQALTQQQIDSIIEHQKNKRSVKTNEKIRL